MPPRIPKRPTRASPGKPPRDPETLRFNYILESILNPPEAKINWRGGTKASAFYNPPPNWGRRVRYGIPVLPILPPSLLPDSSSQRFLFPSPKSSPSRLGPTPSSAAICGAGASWRLLGRKNRVPRGLQKLIKF